MSKKDGDIIDFMLDGIMSFFGWILNIVFKGVLNLCSFLIKGLWNLLVLTFENIVSLFGSKNNVDEKENSFVKKGQSDDNLKK